MRFILSICFSLVFISGFSQSVWNKVDESQILQKSLNERGITPEKYITFQLDFPRLKKRLIKAPMETPTKSLESPIQMDLPMADGTIETFNFYESPCMSPVLAKKFPNIKSYRGLSTTNPYNQARINYGHTGFHATIMTLDGTMYVDPYFNKADENYISYYIKDNKRSGYQPPLACGYDHENHEDHFHDLDIGTEKTKYNQHRKSLPVIKRVYRLALACTGAWGTQQGTVTQVMSKFVTAVNRFNIVFETQMAVRFELIDDNDKLIFFSDNDPYSIPNQGRTALGENTGIINSLVGSNSYDLGHVFTVRCTDVGGVALSGSICRDTKGAGVSCIGNANVDNFVAGTAAHEVGHQLSGGHVWNRCTDQIEGQLSSGTAWEPGSGSTILSYAGSCGDNNVQGSDDDYFNVGSLDQFYFYLAASDCGEEVMTDNNTPDIVPPFGNGVVIPIGTPFELDGEASDVDGDALTFQWEQHNIGPTSELGFPLNNAPSFRSMVPSAETKRSFPVIFDVLAGRSTRVEVLPTVSRDFTFWFTVRDNHPGAGSTVWEEIKFKASDTAGPFRVTEPSSTQFTFVGQDYNVEWDVADTDNELINCQSVNIYLSLDGGRNFDITLAENVANDGNEIVTIPNVLSDNAKIKVKAENNIFFNIGRGELIIREPTTPGFFIETSESIIEACLPDNLEIDLSGTSFLEFDNDVDLEILSGLPEGAEFAFTENPMRPDGSSVLEIDLSGVRDSGTGDLVIQATSADADTVFKTIKLDYVGTAMDEFELVSPISGSAGLGGTPLFSWSKVTNAESYDIEVSESPEFGATNIIEIDAIVDTSIIPPFAVDNSKLYYWRVSATNKCVDKFESEIFTFGTITLACKTYETEDLPKNISATGTPTINSEIEVFDAGTIADVNVKKVKALHGSPRDIRASLISPSGTTVELFDRECSSGSNINLGFDSNSPLTFSCPLNTGSIVKPEKEDLGLFEGEEIEGDWILQFEDTRAGEGGQLQEFSLELCASGTFDAPFLVNNEMMEIKTGDQRAIIRTNLLSDDANNSANELVYTLVETPTKGTLFFNGNALSVGSRFSQASLNNRAVRYNHEGAGNETDSFIFTVIDGEGGWIDLTRFDINIDDDFVSSSEDLIEDNSLFEIYPNPTNNLLYINSVENDNTEWELDMLSIEGKLVANRKLINREVINVSNLEQGIYILRLKSDQGFISYKVHVTD